MKIQTAAMFMELVLSDFSGLEGSCCYCSGEAGAEMRKRISALPLEAVHYIGTGDYHYQTLFWLERIDRPFALLLIDNHPDDQSGAFGQELLSCGNWAARARQLPMLRDFRWIRRPTDHDGAWPDDGLPLYLSIDIDVLSRKYARTGWDQGDMSLKELTTILSGLRSRRGGHGIIGADICGGITPESGGSGADMEINRRTVLAVASALGIQDGIAPEISRKIANFDAASQRP